MKVLIVTIFLLINLITYSQECKEAYRKCIDYDKPYQTSTRSKSTNLFKGETRQFVLTLFKGFEYHFAICSPKKIDNLQIKIREDNETKDLLYDNAIEEFNPVIDMTIEETKKIILEVTIPPGRTPSENRDRICIGVLIQYKR